MQGKRILLIVGGGIAAYKSADLTRRLKEAGADVRVVLTAGGAEFVTPLTFQALSGNPVHTELLDTEAEAAMGHIQLARWADAIIVAPASANFIARLAQGRADDLLSAICLATASPVVIAPAMNQQMWANAATQENLRQLNERGIQQFGPGEGDQACGDIGPGRMLEAEQLAQLTADIFETGSLAGRTVLITAGPTQEAIDPVRYLGNRSSGKQGHAIAVALAAAGAHTVLVSGPTSLADPAGVEVVHVETAREMREAVHDVDAELPLADTGRHQCASDGGKQVRHRGAGGRHDRGGEARTADAERVEARAALVVPDVAVQFHTQDIG